MVVEQATLSIPTILLSSSTQYSLLINESKSNSKVDQIISQSKDNLYNDIEYFHQQIQFAYATVLLY